MTSIEERIEKSVKRYQNDNSDKSDILLMSKDIYERFCLEMSSQKKSTKDKSILHITSYKSAHGTLGIIVIPFVTGFLCVSNTSNSITCKRIEKNGF